MGPLSLPVELVSHIIRLNAAVPLSEGASPSSSRSAELHSFCLVSTVWYATAVPELYKHLALPTPLSAWLLNAATLASWDILARVEGAKSISVGEPPQARLGEGKWWMAESPVVVADAFLQLFAKVRGVEIMCVSGLKELEIRDLSQFSALRILHLNNSNLSTHFGQDYPFFRLTRLTLIGALHNDVVRLLGLNMSAEFPVLRDLVVLDLHRPPRIINVPNYQPNRPIPLPSSCVHLSIDPSVGGILEPTKLRHLILSQRRKQPFPDLNVVLNRIITEDAKLETLALGVEFATTGAIKDALESSPRLASLTRMRISYDGSAEAVEGSADAGLAALCSARGVEIEERFLSQDEMREREQWDWYKKPFEEL